MLAIFIDTCGAAGCGGGRFWDRAEKLFCVGCINWCGGKSTRLL